MRATNLVPKLLVLLTLLKSCLCSYILPEKSYEKYDILQQPCQNDSDCNIKGTYCNFVNGSEEGNCDDQCISCSDYQRTQPPGCIKDPEDCGSCIPGTEGTLSSTSHKCQPVANRICPDNDYNKYLWLILLHLVVPTITFLIGMTVESYKNIFKDKVKPRCDTIWEYVKRKMEIRDDHENESLISTGQYIPVQIQEDPNNISTISTTDQNQSENKQTLAEGNEGSKTDTDDATASQLSRVKRSRGSQEEDRLHIDEGDSLINRENKIKHSLAKREIFRGVRDIPVAVEIIEAELCTEDIEKIFEILSKIKHENIIGDYFYERTRDSEGINRNMYIATELCLCSVADLFDPNYEDKTQIDTRQTIIETLTTKSLLQQSTRGLECFHQKEIVLGYLNPTNFLINQSCVVKITFTDFLLGKLTNHSEMEELPQRKKRVVMGLKGWIAPEMKDGWDSHPSFRPKIVTPGTVANRDDDPGWEQKLDPSSNVFTLGCFYHYVLTGMATMTKDTPVGYPTHPFGGSFIEQERVYNMCNANYHVYQKKWKPQKVEDEMAVDLIKRMIQFDAKKRPKLSEVLEDTYFKNGLGFL